MSEPGQVSQAGPLAAIAHDLYALPPSEFTAARDAAGKLARSTGDRELARAVAALRRPTAAAWAVNLLVRRHLEQVEEVLAVGQALRAAQSALAGDRLRALSGERQQALAALLRQARTMAREVGHPLTEAAAQDVEETLSAALADPAAEKAVRGGLLTAALSYAGLGEVDLSGAVAVLPRLRVVRGHGDRAADDRAADDRAADDQAADGRVPGNQAADDEAAGERAAAQAEADAARQAERRATEAALHARGEADDATHRRDLAQTALARAQEELRAAERSLAEATRAAREAARHHAAVARTAELAAGAASAAEARLARLPADAQRPRR